jgi:gas vesicle protein
MAEENNRQGLVWLLAGIGIGALVGILYAPKSGHETRGGHCSWCSRGIGVLAHSYKAGRRTCGHAG